MDSNKTLLIVGYDLGKAELQAMTQLAALAASGVTVNQIIVVDETSPYPPQPIRDVVAMVRAQVQPAVEVFKEDQGRPWYINMGRKHKKRGNRWKE